MATTYTPNLNLTKQAPEDHASIALLNYNMVVLDTRVAGALNLGNSKTSIPTNANLNAYTTPGSYTCPSNATAETVANSPTTYAYRLDVRLVTNVDNYILQSVADLYGKQWTRSSVDAGGAWTDWSDRAGVAMLAQGISIAQGGSFTAPGIQNCSVVIVFLGDSWIPCLGVKAGASTIYYRGFGLTANLVDYYGTITMSGDTCTSSIGPSMVSHIPSGAHSAALNSNANIVAIYKIM